MEESGIVANHRKMNKAMAILSILSERRGWLKPSVNKKG
jgi:hypothetical protein